MMQLTKPVIQNLIHYFEMEDEVQTLNSMIYNEHRIGRKKALEQQRKILNQKIKQLRTTYSKEFKKIIHSQQIN
jgi:hypothetical protein